MALSDVHERLKYMLPKRDPVEVILGAIEHAGQDREELSTLLGSKEIADAVLISRGSKVCFRAAHHISITAVMGAKQNVRF